MTVVYSWESSNFGLLNKGLDHFKSTGPQKTLNSLTSTHIYTDKLIMHSLGLILYTTVYNFKIDIGFHISDHQSCVYIHVYMCAYV